MRTVDHSKVRWSRKVGSYGRTQHYLVQCPCGYRRTFSEDWRALEDADRHGGRA